jgi:hypothetical protein
VSNSVKNADFPSRRFCYRLNSERILPAAMTKNQCFSLVLGIILFVGLSEAAGEPPVLPIGLDTQHIVQTSNRRFRDDEFIIPRELTRGHSRICVRIN